MGRYGIAPIALGRYRGAPVRDCSGTGLLRYSIELFAGSPELKGLLLCNTDPLNSIVLFAGSPELKGLLFKENIGKYQKI